MEFEIFFRGRETTKEGPKRAVSKFLMERAPITGMELYNVKSG